MRRDPAQDDGFTLVEVLVVLMLLGVVSTMIMSITIGATRAAVRQEDATRTLNQSKVAMERMTRDIRGADSLAVAGHDRIAMVATHDGVRRQVSYAVNLSSKDIERTEVATNLATNVVTTTSRKIVGGLALGRSETVFGFLRGDGVKVKDAAADGSFLLTPDQLKTVASVRVTVSVARASGKPPIQLKQVISIRNLEG
jgi:prepilin-type N-terminal cleavage/methylation domain-containing protein